MHNDARIELVRFQDGGKSGRTTIERAVKLLIFNRIAEIF